MKYSGNISEIRNFQILLTLQIQILSAYWVTQKGFIETEDVLKFERKSVTILLIYTNYYPV